MFCNPQTASCEYKSCSVHIPNGTLAYESSAHLAGGLSTLGHTAVAGCHKGFVVEHPDDLAVLVRDGFEVPGNPLRT
jgi:hypothetical protein